VQRTHRPRRKPVSRERIILLPRRAAGGTARSVHRGRFKQHMRSLPMPLRFPPHSALATAPTSMGRHGTERGKRERERESGAQLAERARDMRTQTVAAAVATMPTSATTTSKGERAGVASNGGVRHVQWLDDDARLRAKSGWRLVRRRRTNSQQKTRRPAVAVHV
jgi:hypothetical protein